jgi:hypothetical protein
MRRIACVIMLLLISSCFVRKYFFTFPTRSRHVSKSGRSWEASSRTQRQQQQQQQEEAGSSFGMRASGSRSTTGGQSAASNVSLSRASGSDILEVFLDHGLTYDHSEVFYSIASLLAALHPGRRIRLYLYREFARRSGLDDIWGRHWNADYAGLRNSVSYEFVDNYTPLYRISNGIGIVSTMECFDVVHDYDLWVLATVRMYKEAVDCLQRYANSSKFMFIVHHAEKGSQHEPMLSWNNAYVCSNASTVRQLTPRHFSPAVMPFPRARAACGLPPVFIVQGSLATGRRVLSELKWLLRMPPEYQFRVRILTRAWPEELGVEDHHGRLEVLLDLNATRYHEQFLDAAFLLPLISPARRATAHYFKGHPTSSIAYASHFNISVIGHHQIAREYDMELSGMQGYYHSGDRHDFAEKVRLALADFERACAIAR